MAFAVSPATIAPGGSLTATGTGARKRAARIRVDAQDTDTPMAVLATFTMPASGKFSRTITGPGGGTRTVKLNLQQQGTDGVWRQTASTTVKVLVAAGGGGGGTTPPTPPADTTAPVASTPVITAITQTSVQVSWTTNEPATGQVEYGTTTSYGSTTTLDSSLTLSKLQTVSGLTAGTLYHYRIKASDAVPNAGNSIDRTFTTAAAAPSPPAAVTGLTATPGNTTVTLNWTAISGATYKVYRDTVLVASPTTNSYVDTGRTNGVLYSYKVSAVTGGGEGAQSTAATATPSSPPADTTAPTITSVTAGQTVTTCAVAWVTNEPATGQVEYGTTTAYGSTTTLDSTLTTSKSQNLTGLTGGTLYHFRIKAADAATNLRTSQDYTFTTNTSTTPPPPPGVNLADYGGNWLNAINAAKTNGNLVFVPAGTWPAPKLVLYAGLTIQGVGPTSKATRSVRGLHAAGGFFHVQGVANVTIKDLDIYGWPIANGLSDDILINGINAPGLTVTDVNLYNAQGAGIQVEGTMTGSLFEDITITNTLYRDNGYHGVALWPYHGTSNCTFRRITIDGADYAGVFCDAGTTVGTAAGVDDNVFEDITIRHAARKPLPNNAGIGAGWMVTGGKRNIVTGFEITDQLLGAGLAFGLDQSGLTSTGNVFTGGRIGRIASGIPVSNGGQTGNTVQWVPA